MIKKEQYQTQKQRQKEGFTSFDTQICVPVKDEDGVEEMEDVAVTRTFEASIVEDAQTAFMHMMNALIIIVIFSVGSPYLMIQSLTNAENSYALRLALTIITVGILVAAISLLSTAVSHSGGRKSRQKKQEKIFLGVYFLIVVFSIWMSVTFAKMSNISFSNELDFGQYFGSGRRAKFLDVFEVFTDFPHNTE